MTQWKKLMPVVLGIFCVFGLVALVQMNRPVAPEPLRPEGKPHTRAVEPPRGPGEVTLETPSPQAPLEPAPSALEKSGPAVTPGSSPPKAQPGVVGGPAPNASDPPPTDPLARAALNLVGLDPEAEEYWVDAINDPRLPAEERQNLIEDLNEDGLADPKHPRLEELPLIWSRLRLVEQLAPVAMDQVNFDAFLEAYKDLLNLAELAQGRGEPVN